jgi:phosphoheptose isomerase
MYESTGRFRDYYADQFATGMSNFLRSYGERIIGELHGSLVRRRSTIYLFGNGGSHAIGKCIGYGLQTYAAVQDLPLRIQTGVDIHQATVLTDNVHSGTSFVETLKTEGADSLDLIVLISGSGNSDNLCEVAQYANARSIPTFALVGSGGGKLPNFILPSRCFSVPLVDQQISEDIIQSLACFLDEPLESANGLTWAERVIAREEELRSAIKHIPESFVTNIADTVVETFFTRKFLWVLGVDHPALSACAEHVAHNLYWDGVYEVSNPPPRLVFSSPTACDFSGISNDRRRDIIEVLSGVSDLKGQGAALLYSMSADHPALNSLVDHLSELRVPTYLLFAEGEVRRKVDSLTAHRTGLQKPQHQALLAQILGHILGRLIRLRLIEQNGSHASHDLSNPTQFLINFDLAQRRLLDA